MPRILVPQAKVVGPKGEQGQEDEETRDGNVHDAVGNRHWGKPKAHAKEDQKGRQGHADMPCFHIFFFLVYHSGRKKGRVSRKIGGPQNPLRS